jgi:hypothetical protein
MASITLRSEKGSPLSNAEVDSNFSNLNTELGQKESASNKGVAGGYASLDGSGKVPSTQLPSYVDDVVEAANFLSLPGTGETGKIYVVLDTNKTYRWSGSAYVEISASPGSTDAVTEGSTNLYFTTARARSSVSASGSLSYNSTTGVFSYTAPTNVSSFTNDSGYITSSALSPYLTSSTAASTYQTTLVSGTSIKTVNGNSLLGSGNIQIDGGVTSFNTRTGAVTLSSSDVTTALGYTPYNAANQLNSLGQIRARGWYNSPATGSATGLALEIGISAGQGFVYAYDRDAGSYAAINLGSSSANLQVSGSAVNVSSGSLQQGGNQVLHAGNYTSYSPSLTGSGASGAWGISITGNAATASNLSNNADWMIYRGSVAQANQDSATSNGFYTRNNTGDSSAILTFNAGGSVGPWQLHVTYGGTFEFRNKTDSNTWNSFKQVLHSANYSGYALPLSGGQLTGQVEFRSANQLTFSDGANSMRGFIKSLANTGTGAAGLVIATSGGESIVFKDGNADSGDINFVIRGDGVLLQGGSNTLLHAGNYSSYALPLSGGTVSGAIRASQITAGGSTNTDANLGVQGTTHLTGTIYYGGTVGNVNSWSSISTSSSGTHTFSASRFVFDRYGYGSQPLLSLESGAITLSQAAYAGSGITVNSGSAAGIGINLYSGSPTSPTYGLYFAQTVNFGTYGAVSADWATYFTMNSTANRGWIFREVETLGNVAAISNQGNMTLRSHFEQGNNIARPNVNWSAGSTSTGMVIFYLPGTTSNYGMIHMVFDIYEYNGNAVSTVIVGGHNWSTSWYNVSANVIGQCGKEVRLGVKDGRFCVVFGTSGSTWEYGTIVLRKIHNASFYDNVMDMVGNWSATQTTTESFTSVTGDLRALRTPASFNAGGAITQAGNQVLHAANYSSYAVPLSGGTMSGRLTISPGWTTTGRNYSNEWIEFANASGLYSTINNAHFYPNNASYGPWRINGSRNGWGGLEFDAANTNVSLMCGTDGNTVGWHANSYGWKYRWASGYLYVYRSTYGGGTECTVLDAGNYNSYSPSLTGSGASGSWNITAARATRANGNFYIDDNYGNGIVGVYSSTRYQGVFAMGDSYKLPADGTSAGNLYGMAWSYPSAGGVAGNLDSHGMLVLINGGFGSCMSYSIKASGNVTAYSDERLKTNWRPMPESFVERLAAVKVGIYDRTDGERITQVGVSAQSLQAVLPEAITKAADEMGTLSVSYGNAAMASAVELAKELVALKRELAELKSRLH